MTGMGPMGVLISRVLVLACLYWHLPVVAVEAGEGTDVSRIKDLQTALDAENKNADGPRPQFAPVLIPDEFLDAEGKQALKTSLRSYYEYRTQGFEHRQRVFEWQLLSSKLIFVVVIFLVIAGVYFSWLQFRVEMRRQEKGGEEHSPSTLEATAQGIKVSSPVLGVIILVISLLFFYLYLVHVYPIEEIL